MTVHTSVFLKNGDHSRDLLYVHTTSLSSSGSGTQQGMAWSWATLTQQIAAVRTGDKVIKNAL